MNLLDWLIMLLPIVAVLFVAFYSRRYVRGVVDYIAAGRCGRRYVMTVGDMASSLSIISVVALVEAKYQTGLSVAFWEMLMVPVGIILGFTGYCTYRFRETRVLSNGQFLEIRYSRSFRIVGSLTRVFAELLCNSVGPAIAASFFIYFLDLPHTFVFCGITFDTFTVLVAIIVLLALAVIWPGGRIALLITDCLQGICCYPVFVAIVLFVLLKFSWTSQVAPVMTDRVPGESFINPFDIKNLREFNIFSVFVWIAITGIWNSPIWLGGDNAVVSKTPHEGKMAGILSRWRGIIRDLMALLVAITIITVMNHRDFSGFASGVRAKLADKIGQEILRDSGLRPAVNEAFARVPVPVHNIGTDAPYSQVENADTPYMAAAHQALGTTPQGNYLFQRFRTIYYQMMMPVAIREILPHGLLGLFALLMVMLMLTTDDSRIFNSTVTIIQDIVVPMRKKPLTPKQHLWYLRFCALAISVFFFVVSVTFVSLDYIQMFLIIIASIWAGCASPVMTFGLYSRFGNAWGAWASLVFGSGSSVGAILLQRNWSDVVYPFLESHGWAGPIGSFLTMVSKPLNPYVVWNMDPVKFPINSYELVFINAIIGIVAYVAGSLLTYRRPFNLDKMLHRGQYADEASSNLDNSGKWSMKRLAQMFIGFTPEYSKGDKLLTWGVFLYTIVYDFLFCFIFVIIWNCFSPWPTKWWTNYYYITSLLIAAIIGGITAVWFTWGGIKDSIALLRDLGNRLSVSDEDGSVSDNDESEQ